MISHRSFTSWSLLAPFNGMLASLGLVAPRKGLDRAAGIGLVWLRFGGKRTVLVNNGLHRGGELWKNRGGGKHL